MVALSTLAAGAAGIAAGAAGYRAEQAEAPFRAERLKQAQLQTQQAEAQLKQAPVQLSNAELQNQLFQAQIKQTQAALLKSQTFDAFKQYQAEGDVRHLNNFYTEAKKTAQGASLFGNLVRVDKLERSADTEQMLRAAGVVDLDGFFSDPELLKSMVVSTDNSGQKTLTDMNKVYQGTGFTNHMLTEQLDLMAKQAELKRLMFGGASMENVTARERVAREWAAAQGIPVWEAYQKLDAAKGGSSTLERLTEQVLAENPSLSYLQAAEQATGMLRSTEDERRAASRAGAEGDASAELEAIKTQKARTTAEKDVVAAESTRAKIDELAGGSIFEANLADPVLRRKIGPEITALEKLADTKLSTEDKRLAREMRNLVQLGGTAGTEITSAETGPVDYMLKTFKKYMVDEVGGIEAVSNYEQFRNIFRNALYGASLTQAETDAFTRAAGSLAQQKGPVLVQLKTQLESIKNNLSSLYDTNDPYIAEYYLGMDRDKLDSIIEAVDDRVALISGSQPKKKGFITAEPKVQRKSLDEIFSGAN